MKENVYCPDDYGTYNTLTSARTACASDSNCEAVYDEFCDNSNFHLCPLNYDEMTSATSCLFLKNGRYRIILTAEQEFDFKV